MTRAHVTIHHHTDFRIDTHAWLDQRVGAVDEQLTHAVGEFAQHPSFLRYQPHIAMVDRVLVWCAARGYPVDEEVEHDDVFLTKAVTAVFVTIDGRDLVIACIRADQPIVYTEIAVDRSDWQSTWTVDILCPAGHRYTWTGGQHLITANGQTTVSAIFGGDSPIVACRTHPDRGGEPLVDGPCHGGAVYCPDCERRCHLALPPVPTIDAPATNDDGDGDGVVGARG